MTTVSYIHHRWLSQSFGLCPVVFPVEVWLGWRGQGRLVSIVSRCMSEIMVESRTDVIAVRIFVSNRSKILEC